ncbi:POK9 protein, partial [Circaetus pectoralis]|nr:POK9 protein [Circaetus pectoralis]
AGIAGVDVSAIETILLWNSQVHRVPVNAQGPLGNGLSALLLGRSSITLQGIFALPGVIDADYTGRIYAMIWTLSPPVSIQEGSRIAQLVPFKANVPCKVNQQRGNAGFGSMGLEAQIMWSMEINKTKPSISVELQNAKNRPEKIKLQALVDTGADVTVLS